MSLVELNGKGVGGREYVWKYVAVYMGEYVGKYVGV